MSQPPLTDPWTLPGKPVPPKPHPGSFHLPRQTDLSFCLCTYHDIFKLHEFLV